MAEALTPPAGADSSVLGGSKEDLRNFALRLKCRLNIIGVQLQTLWPALT